MSAYITIIIFKDISETVSVASICCSLYSCTRACFCVCVRVCVYTWIYGAPLLSVFSLANKRIYENLSLHWFGSLFSKWINYGKMRRGLEQQQSHRINNEKKNVIRRNEKNNKSQMNHKFALLCVVFSTTSNKDYSYSASMCTFVSHWVMYFAPLFALLNCEGFNNFNLK